MATLNAAGELQLEQGDVLPDKIAVRDDDPAEVRQLIDDLNPTIETAEDLAAALAEVDAMRRELASKRNKNNPHLATGDITEGDTPSTPKVQATQKK